MGLSFAKKFVEIFVEKHVFVGHSSWPTALTLGLVFLPFASAGTVSTFDDIQFWVGSGANRAAVAIDWDDTGTVDKSLVWGYRWDGVATGEDMLLTVLESDTRLFAAVGTSLFGLGYDLDNDSALDISDGTVFDSDGLAFIPGVLNDNVVPAATATNPNDFYAEGWFSGFWHYGLSNRGLGSGDPFDGATGGDEWVSSGGSMAGRVLSDGDWDSWAFTPTFDFTSFAENPVAAESPFSADFDSDDDTDGADFLAWQRGFGIDENALLEQGDADGNGTVDRFDLQIWSTNFGSGHFDSGRVSGALQSTLLVVPEPSCIACALWIFFLVTVHREKKKKTQRHGEH